MGKWLAGHIDTTALWKDIRFTSERRIYALLSEGKNNDNIGIKCGNNQTNYRQYTGTPALLGIISILELL